MPCLAAARQSVALQGDGFEFILFVPVSTTRRAKVTVMRRAYRQQTSSTQALRRPFCSGQFGYDSSPAFFSQKNSQVVQRQHGGSGNAETEQKDELAREPEDGAVVQRMCAACEAERKDEASTVQPKHTMDEPGDRYEREADRIAEHVVGQHQAADNSASVKDSPDSDRPVISPFIMRQAEGGTAVSPKAQQSIRQSRGGGAELPSTLRASMEAAIGVDFGKVRIHTDGNAQALNRSLSARAFTTGQDIYFGSSAFQPSSVAGQKLVAHELAHVVQQGKGQATVQRDGEKDKAPAPAAKIDVAIVLSDDDQDFAEGRAYATTVLRVTDGADAAVKLKALGSPIGRLFVVSHSNGAGQVEFTSSIGTVSWVPIGDLAKAIKGAATIDAVDFRGCKIGDAPGAMESFRSTVGAKSTMGSNCWTFVQRATPLTIDGVPVTVPNQIPLGKQKAFDQAMLKQLSGMVSADGKPVQNCLVGLARGEKANSKTLSKIWRIYWANSGNLVASWASPEYNQTWQEGSICVKDMTADTKPCATVEVKDSAAIQLELPKKG